MKWGTRAVLAALILISLSPSLVQASVQLGDYNTGMVGYWPLNEGVGASPKDLSGSNNTTTFGGSPSWTSGRFGDALSFSGAQYASTTLSWPVSAGTISVWVYPTSYTNWISPAGWKLLGANNGYILLDEGGSGGTGKWRAVFKPNNSGATESDAVAQQNITQNTWQHVVMTWSLSGTTWTINLYVNGALQSSATWSGTAGSAGVGHFHFGNAGDYPDNYFLGKVDDVRVYDHALSGAQIEALYQSGVPVLSMGTLNLNALSSGLVGYWSMNGSSINWTTGALHDDSGTGNTGQLVGMSTSTAEAPGKIGQALSFDGANYVKVQDTSSLDLTTNFSIGAWVKPSAFGNCNGIVSKYQTSGDNEYFLRLSCSSAQNHYVDFGGSTDFTETSVPLVAGRWYHVVAVATGGTGYIYINGVLAGSGSIAITNTNDFVSIGSDYTTSGARYWSGSIDDVRIYDRALSSTEVALLYALGTFTIGHTDTSLVSNGLVGEWSFDGPTINWATGVVKDVSGNGNNGQMVNMSTTTSPVPGKTGQALSFNGSSQYVSVPDAFILDPSSTMTLCGWFKLASTGTNRLLIFKWGNNTNTPNQYNFYYDGTYFSFNVWSNGANVAAIDSAAEVANKWYFLCGTADGTNVDLYSNGSLISHMAYNGTIQVPASPNALTIAAKKADGTIFGPYFNGSIDDVRIYNLALSAHEIAALYAAGK